MQFTTVILYKNITLNKILSEQGNFYCLIGRSIKIMYHLYICICTYVCCPKALLWNIITIKRNLKIELSTITQYIVKYLSTSYCRYMQQTVDLTLLDLAFCIHWFMNRYFNKKISTMHGYEYLCELESPRTLPFLT